MLNLLNAFSTENFTQALAIMGKGMLGIFIVIGVIILGITLLNKATSPKKKSDDEHSNE